MSTDLSPTTRALLRTARSDGPSAAARAKILSGIAAGTAGAAGASAGIGAAAKATLSAASAKLLVTGALFGSVVTVGLAAMVLRVSTPKLAPEPAYVHADSDVAIAPAARGALVDETRAPRPVATTREHARMSAPADDSLAREAALIAEARSAILRGEPDVALAALRGTAALRSRAMVPEELSLEARALRAAGRDVEATAIEEQLRSRFPDNALSR